MPSQLPPTTGCPSTPPCRRDRAARGEAAVAHVDLGRAHHPLADVGQSRRQPPHQQQVDHQVEVVADGGAADAEAAGDLGGVQQPSLLVGEHRPQPPQRLRRDTRAELRDVALEVGADEVPSPAQAGRVVGGEEALGKAAAHPELVEPLAAHLGEVEGRQLGEGDPSGQGLAALGQQLDRGGAEQQEPALPLSFAPAPVDRPAQRFEDARGAVDLVEHRPARRRGRRNRARARPGAPGRLRTRGRGRRRRAPRRPPAPASSCPTCRGPVSTTAGDVPRAGGDVGLHPPLNHPCNSKL